MAQRFTAEQVLNTIKYKCHCDSMDLVKKLSTIKILILKIVNMSQMLNVKLTHSLIRKMV